VLISLRRAMRNWLYNVMTKTLGDEQDCVTLTTLRGPARGLRFRLDIRTRMESSYWLGKYDLKILRAIANICQQGWIIWDCGVYIGFYTVFFSRLVGPNGKVVAFEPDPNNLQRAKNNVDLNKLHNVRFVHTAIGAPLGETDFILSNNTNSHLPGSYVGASMNTYTSIEQAESSFKVLCTSFDELFLNKDIPSPNLIKIDIEGAEIEALQYIHQLTQDQRPLLVLELHNPDCDAAAWSFAQREGYVLKSLDTDCIITQRKDVYGTLLCLPLEYHIES
jgi:FkbM family methyltransferase